MPEQDDVRLRLRVRLDHQRVLRPERGTAAAPAKHEFVQARDADGVLDADRRHFDDLPPDELDPVVLIEDSDLDHPVVLVQSEAAPGDLDVRCHAGHSTRPARVVVNAQYWIRQWNTA